MIKNALLFLGSALLCLNSSAALIPYGAGNISDTINPAGYLCTVDHGTWIHNAGVVKPGVNGCDPIGAPTPILPQLVAPASDGHTPSHRWWGSVPFLGEMKVNNTADAAYITPDPITARISDRGVRVLGIPGGLKTNDNSYQYAVPDPFNEVFDGLAVANTAASDMDAYLKQYSDGSMTVQWNQGSTPIMEATFVYGSPYIFFEAFQGDFLLRSKAQDGPEKTTYHQEGNVLGVWTDVASNRNTYLVVGHGNTTFANTDSAEITVSPSSKKMTLAWLPVGSELPNQTMIDDFAQLATNEISAVNINYSVNRANNEVTVSHHYVDGAGNSVNTLAGMMPLQWKNSSDATTGYQTRSARGIVKFAQTESFSYRIPFLGLLPFFPENIGDYDQTQLQALITEFVNQGEANWNDKTDTYWAGKNYGKVAELSAIARTNGMVTEADLLLNWLKGELEDWFHANTNGSLDVNKYFVYDDEWNTLLGFDESFGAQQQLNDHHFHYGYFVRAAAEICRVDRAWCGQDAFGPMVELLIRDYAGGRNDSLFPYLRNFDPANGFSWASGHANFVLGNNNESTSEAANAYGAIILYGLITGNEELVERGMYLHASSTATYWEYWNNIDRFRGFANTDRDNFPSDYTKMTTSIIWGNGMVFSTWFSGAYAHILGIQGLPLSPLVLHIGQHADYLKDYVTLGMTESSNGKPSGLPEDQWRDVWWNIWAMTDGQAAVDDFHTYNFNYEPEAGETKGHVYHWIYTLKQLGHVATGTGALTANHPAALAFNNKGSLTYLAYNFSTARIFVEFSDGMAMNVNPGAFAIKRTGDNPDSPITDHENPSAPGQPNITNITSHSASASWSAATDNVGVTGYEVSLTGGSGSVSVNGLQATLTGLAGNTQYLLAVTALDGAGNRSLAATNSFTTLASSDTQAPTQPGELVISQISQTGVHIEWAPSTDNVGVIQYQLTGSGISKTSNTNALDLADLTPGTQYNVSLVAIDAANNHSNARTGTFTTLPIEQPCTLVCFNETDSSTLRVTVNQGDVADIHYRVNNGGQMNVRMTPSGSSHIYDIQGLNPGDTIDASFTTITNGVGQNIDWQQYQFNGGGSQPTMPSVANLAASNLSASSADICWQAPSLPSGASLSGYQVQVSQNGNVIFSNTTTQTCVAVNNLIGNQSYQATVITQGNWQDSNPVQITFQTPNGGSMGGLLQNGDFSTGTSPWYLAYQSGFENTATFTTPGGVARVVTTNGNGSPERVKLVQNVGFEPLKQYTISFDIRTTSAASKPVYFSTWIKEVDGNFFNQLVWANQNWQTVSHSFSYSGDYSMYTLALAFKLANGDVGIEIDNVSVVEN